MFTRSAHLYDAIYHCKDYAAEAEKVQGFVGRYARRPCRTMLDVACGTGAHIAHLKAHYEVEGVDLDDGMLAVARERYPEVAFHHGDMTDFDLGKRFDAVVCLFSSVGYTKTTDRLDSAVRCMANHVNPGGVVVIEPWTLPERFHADHPSATFVDDPDLKIARLAVARVTDRISWFDFHYLVATADGVDHFVERHELALFTHEEYLAAFHRARLETIHEPDGLGRGLYMGILGQ